MVDDVFPDGAALPTVQQVDEVEAGHRLVQEMGAAIATPAAGRQNEIFVSDIQRHLVRAQQLRRLWSRMRAGWSERPPHERLAALLVAIEIAGADLQGIAAIAALPDETILSTLLDRGSLQSRLMRLTLLHGEELPAVQLRVLDLLVAHGERERTPIAMDVIDLLAVDLFDFQWLGTRFECDAEGRVTLYRVAHPDQLASRRRRFGLPGEAALPQSSGSFC